MIKRSDTAICGTKSLNIGFSHLKNLTVKEVKEIEQSINSQEDIRRNKLNTAACQDKISITSCQINHKSLNPLGFKVNWSAKERAIREIKTENMLKEMGVELL
jgi:hypothetical protein